MQQMPGSRCLLSRDRGGSRHRAAPRRIRAERADNHSGDHGRSAQADQRLNIRRRRQVPANVSFATNGPGSGNIFMRGLSAGFAGNQSSATIAQFPNVATYLDDQSLQFPARNLDVYFVDMDGRSAGRSAGHPVWAVRSRRSPLHHEQAQARRGLGQCRGELRRYGPRRSEQQHQCDAQLAADRGHPGSPRRHLQRSAWRLYHQRAEHLHT